MQQKLFRKYLKQNHLFQEILMERPESWELNNYYHLVLIAVINKLSSQQRNVRFAELETLESLNTGVKETISKNN